jgi:hypothetical protein
MLGQNREIMNQRNTVILYLYFCGFFKNGVHSSEYIVSADRTSNNELEGIRKEGDEA